MNIKTTLKASVAAAALFAVAVPVAEAGTVSNSSKFNVSLSGHLNKGMFYHDNGKDEGIYQGDNVGSGSRARIVASGKINEAMSVTATTEWAMSASDASTLDPNDRAASLNGTEAGTDSFFAIRHNYINLAHKQFGSVAIGHTSPASDGISEFGGMGNVQYGTGGLFAGSVTLVRDNAAQTRATGTDVGAFKVAVDGTRTSVIKYTTPTIGGLNLQVSHSNEQESDIAARFSGKFGDIGVSAGVAYTSTDATSTTQENRIAGGIALSHGSGLSVDFNYGERNMVSSSTFDPKTMSIGANYIADLTSMGSTTFRIAYSKSDDATAKDDELRTWAGGVEQGLADGVAVYAGYQKDDVSQASSVDYESVTTIFAGTKVVF